MLNEVLKTQIRVFLAVSALVFLSRVPFLSAGYGTDPDAWRMVHVAGIIGQSHQYMASRLPGYPLQELVYAAVPYKIPEVLNGLTALVGSAGIGVFALLLFRLKSKDFFLGSLAFACTPIIYVNSTSTIDYVWASTFVMISLYLLFEQKVGLAGLFLGLAIGCRITSAAMLLPFSLFLYRHTDRRNFIPQILRFVSTAFGIGVLLFVPVIARYGRGFFQFSETGQVRFIDILKRATFDVFGMIGILALLGTVLFFFFSRRVESTESSIPNDPKNVLRDMSLVVLLLYGIAFLRLPSEAGYLMPAIPFLLLLAATVLRRYQFVMLCAGLIVSSFFVSIDSTDRPWSPKPSIASITFEVSGRKLFVDFLAGPVVNDHRCRVERMKYVARVIEFSKSLEPNSIIVAGNWLPQLAVTLNKKLDFVSAEESIHSNGVEFVGLLDSVRDPGRQIFFFPGQDLYDRAVFDLDLRRYGAKELNL